MSVNIDGFPIRSLIFGGKGWIAGLLKDCLEKRFRNTKHVVISTTIRIENREEVLGALRQFQPTHVYNCAGRTGRPNVDWCEENKEDTLRSNAIGTLNLADCCFLSGIHCTIFATGCLYQYDDAHPIGGPGFTEVDPPNFDGSFYSSSKGHVEQLLKTYPNCLILRLRMPVSNDLHERSFVTKIINYERVIDIPNSNSILSDLLPLATTMAISKDTGVYNFTNPGAISHNEVLNMFRDTVRPDFKWKNCSQEELATMLKAGRSNCTLDTTKLENKAKQYGIDLLEIHVAYARCFSKMKAAGVK